MSSSGETLRLHSQTVKLKQPRTIDGKTGNLAFSLLSVPLHVNSAKMLCRSGNLSGHQLKQVAGRRMSSKSLASRMPLRVMR